MTAPLAPLAPLAGPAPTPAAEDAAPPPAIVLAGRTFNPVVAPTFSQDLHVMRAVRAAGLDALPQGTAATPDALGLVLDRVLASDQMLPLLAGTLVEEGATWTPAGAAANAAFFAELTDPADKGALQDAFVSLLADCFVGALRSSTGLLGPWPATSPAVPTAADLGARAAADRSPTPAPSSAPPPSPGRSLSASGRP